MRLTVPAVLVAVSFAVAHAQEPRFDVASIKRNTSASDRSSIRAQPGRVTVTNTTLFTLIRNAYRRESFEIAGGPDWIHTDRWDIVAAAPPGADEPAMLAMARALLADRFKLKVRIETRDMPTFALVRARADRLGPQIQPSTLNCPKSLAELRARDLAGPSTAPNGAPVCGSDVFPGRYVASARSLNEIVRVLTPLSGRMVVDRTGLTGTFDLSLQWNDSEQGPSFFTALQEQLGLKLDSQRGPVEVLVIESVERPNED